MKFILPILALTVSCSDYDLVRDKDETDIWQYDTAEPTGSWPDIEVFPMSLDFGTLPIDCQSNPQIITITNVGSEVLEVESIELAGAKMIAPFYGTSMYVWAAVLAVTVRRQTNLNF